MKLIIGHLYNDLMNLYGEIGNIKALTYGLKKQNIKVEVKNLSLNDDINFNELDLIYIGSGTEENRFIVLKDILKYKDSIIDAINNNKTFIITGNALALFGKNINDEDALNVFDFTTKEIDKRQVNEIVTNTKLIKDDIYGFINHQDEVTYNKVNNLFGDEGIHHKNFYGTYLIGPVLVRNPELLKHILKELIKNKDKKFKTKTFDFKLEKEAYKEYIEFKKNKIHIK